MRRARCSRRALRFVTGMRWRSTQRGDAGWARKTTDKSEIVDHASHATTSTGSVEVHTALDEEVASRTLLERDALVRDGKSDLRLHAQPLLAEVTRQASLVDALERPGAERSQIAVRVEWRRRLRPSASEHFGAYQSLVHFRHDDHRPFRQAGRREGNPSSA